MRRAILRNRLNLISPKHQHYSDYLINYSIRQWLPALRKAVTTGEKIAIVFFTCVWYRQSAAHVTRLSLHSLTNERQSLHHSQSEVVCRIFSDYGCYNTIKPLSLTDSDIQAFQSCGQHVWNWCDCEEGKLDFLISSVGISENSFQPP